MSEDSLELAIEAMLAEDTPVMTIEEIPVYNRRIPGTSMAQDGPCACIAEVEFDDGGEPHVFILVNDQFEMAEADLQMGILYHEVGHYVNGHIGTPWRVIAQEIEADRYACEHGYAAALLADIEAGVTPGIRDQEAEERIYEIKRWLIWNQPA